MFLHAGAYTTGSYFMEGVLDSLLEGRKKLGIVTGERGTALGQAAFGSFWNAMESDWEALERITKWESESRKCQHHSRCP